MATTTLRSFVNDLSNIVSQTKVQSSVSLASGSCPTMEAYNRRVGRIEGMEEVVKVAREMLGQLESADQDDGSLGELPKVSNNG